MKQLTLSFITLILSYYPVHAKEMKYHNCIGHLINQYFPGDLGGVGKGKKQMEVLNIGTDKKFTI